MAGAQLVLETYNLLLLLATIDQPATKGNCLTLAICILFQLCWGMPCCQ